MDEYSPDVAIIGGGLGGCAAALAVARAGRTCVLTEACDWIGGQLTAQAVPPDEHGWIEGFGCTATYRRLREEVRQHYRRWYPLTPAARADPRLNPGNGWVSPLCHEPRAALAVLHGMLAPHQSSGRVVLLAEHEPVGAELAGREHVRAVRLRCRRTGEEVRVASPYTLDATPLGDLLPLAGVEHVTGQEARSQTGEPSAPQVARPGNVQAFSVCFAMDYREGEDHTLPRPADYDFWRAYVPQLTPPWPGPLLSWSGVHPRTMETVTYHFHPHREEPRAFAGLWTYRRILDRGLFEPGAFASDICLVNWPLLDYWQGDLAGATPAERAAHVERARQQSRCVLYWLQTEAPRPDGGQGWPGLRLRGDVTGGRLGLAREPYIRESRRIQAEFTVCEGHVAQACRPDETLAERFADSVGIGYYRIDLHPSTGGDNFVDVASLPFQIPLGALIPVRVENLLPAALDIGTTHITNGCYRLHPVEWNIGEAAGALAAWCLERGTTPRQVYRRRDLRAAFQQALVVWGVELRWPAGLRLEDGDPHVHAMDRPA
ncbi:MAG: FAD-dependent oxidoreductase [Candidatus Latescibacterota bacterium]